MDVVRVGMLGCGTVGGGVAELLARGADDLAARSDARLQLTRVAVRDVARDRGLPPSVELTDDPRKVAEADDVDLVVEVMGGIEPARTLVSAALRRGAPVVSANKELVAAGGAGLHDLADDAGVDLLYEAAVAAAIPILRPLRHSLAGDRVTKVVGILNGTTNYVLTRMAAERAPFDDVLADAQRLGYAEADPSADVDGHDAAAKLAILAGLAFDTVITGDQVSREGIRRVTPTDLGVAARLGYVVKLLGIATRDADEEVDVRVHPTFLRTDHPLASVDGVFNAVYVEADAAGELMFYGRGAGASPTASAVVGDVVAAARNLRAGSTSGRRSRHRPVRLRPLEDLWTQYDVLLDVADEPGVLAAVAETFGRFGVSIAQVWQEGAGDHAQLVLVTHRAREGALRGCVDALADTRGVRSVRNVLRVESEGGA